MNKSSLLLIVLFLVVVLTQQPTDSIDPIVLPTSEDNIKKQTKTIPTPQPIVVESKPQPTTSQQPINNQNTNDQQNLQGDQKTMENVNPQPTEAPPSPQNTNQEENQLNQQSTQEQPKEPEKQPQITQPQENKQNILKEQQPEPTPEPVVSEETNKENMRASVDPIVVDQKPQQNTVQVDLNQKPQEAVPQKSQEQKKKQQEQLRQRAQKQFQQERIRVEKQRQADEIRARSQAAARKAQAQRLKEEEGMTEEEKRQRSQKYRAEQERIMEIKRRQKEAEKKYAQQRQQKGNPQVNYETDGQISKSALKKIEQKKARHNTKKALNDIKNPGTQNFIFQIVSQTHEFVFTPSTDQLVNFDIKIYVKHMNSYTQMKNIEEDGPVKLYVYEDNRRIVNQAQFYFLGAVNTQTKANIQYTLRFFNNGNEKLVEVRHSQLVQASKVNKLLDTDEAKKHADETRQILEDMFTVIKNRQLSWVMQVQSYGQFNSRLNNYSIFEVLEMIVTIGICLGQVKLIKRMLSKDSII